MRLAIADDQGSNRVYLSKILQKMGHDVVACEDGRHLLDLAVEGTIPQLIFLDWMMPGMSGIEVCEALRKMPRLPYLHIVMLTGRSSQEDIIAGMRAGANDFLTKPIRSEEFQNRLNNAIKMIELHNLLEQQKLAQIQAYRLMGINQIAQNLVSELSEPIVAMLEQLSVIDHALEEGNSAAIRIAHDNLVGAALNIGKTVRNIGLLSTDLSSSAKERITVASLFQQLGSFFSGQAAKSRVGLFLEPIHATVDFEGKRSEIFQALVNLVDNAVHAAALGSQKWVRLEASHDSNEIRIRVTDSGRGLSDEVRKKLFEPFFSTKIEGNGLGLSITREIIHRHGGWVRVDDNSPNTSFVILLPRRHAAAASDSEAA